MRPEPEHIQILEQDRVLTLLLNRPQQRNALNGQLLGELLQCLRWIEQAGGYRVLVIRGAGPVFCGGADLDWFRERNHLPEKELVADAELFFDCYEGLFRLPIPSICFVQGAAYGGANGLLAASDLVIAAADTRFSFSEVKLGLVPATIAPFVLNRIGYTRTKELMLTGRVITAGEALETGLINYSCESGTEEECLVEQLNLFRQTAPVAVSKTKKLLNKLSLKGQVPDLKVLTTTLLASARHSDEAREGISAFFDKRNPDWANQV